MEFKSSWEIAKFEIVFPSNPRLSFIVKKFPDNSKIAKIWILYLVIKSEKANNLFWWKILVS